MPSTRFGDPATEHDEDRDQPAVRADDPSRRGLRQLETAFGDRVIEAITEDAEHLVEGKALPRLDSEKVGQADRMAQQGAFGGPALRLSRCCHGATLRSRRCSVADGRKRFVGKDGAALWAGP